MKYIFYLLGIGLFVAFFVTGNPTSGKQDFDVENLPVKGMVTMLDLGAKSCIPCKMMAPILERLEKKYQGKAAIVFIDIREYPKQIPRYGVQAMPTQIFYDSEGNEVYRHMGFLGEEEITAQLIKMGVN